MGYSRLDLTGKVAVVIGGSSGIGRTISRGLAEAGADVVPTARRLEQVEAVAAEIEALGRRSLRMVSDVTDRDSLEKLLRAAVTAFGKVDILLVPSWEEPFGIVLLESMAAGVPVISTTAGGPQEIIVQGESGILVPAKNPGALADAIRSLAASDSLLANIVRQARKRVEAEDLAVLSWMTTFRVPEDVHEKVPELIEEIRT